MLAMAVYGLPVSIHMDSFNTCGGVPTVVFEINGHANVFVTFYEKLLARALTCIRGFHVSYCVFQGSILLTRSTAKLNDFISCNMIKLQ